VNVDACACVYQRDSFGMIVGLSINLCLCVCFIPMRDAEKRRDGYQMRQSAYTCVNSCLPCPQGTLSVREPADERAGGRPQRLDQLAVRVSPPIYIYTYIHIYISIYTYSPPIYIDIYMYIHTYTYIHTYPYIHICNIVCMYIYI